MQHQPERTTSRVARSRLVEIKKDDGSSDGCVTQRSLEMHPLAWPYVRFGKPPCSGEIDQLAHLTMMPDRRVALPQARGHWLVALPFTARYRAASGRISTVKVMTLA